MGLISSIISYLYPNRQNTPLTDRAKNTILVIDDYVPYHDKSSGSKRLYELIKLLTQLNYHVIFLPDDGKLTQPYAKDLLDLGVEVLHAQNKKQLISELVNRSNSFMYAWISRPALNLKYHKLLNKNAKKIFDTVDLHYLRMLRQAENENSSKLGKRALKTKNLELDIARSSTATVTVTAKEKDTLTAEGIDDVFVIPNVHTSHVIQNQPGFNERKGLLFIGSYKHDPNVDAVRWMVNEIMPQIWKKDASIQLTLLGSDPTDEILGYRSDHIIVPGYIKDVSSYFNCHKIFISPLRYGAGMKGKIGQSLEFGLPIVSTDIGIEGMDLMNEQNVLVANTTSEFVNQTLLLYNSETLWNTIKENSIQAINQYSPENVKQKLTKLFEAIE